MRRILARLALAICCLLSLPLAAAQRPIEQLASKIVELAGQGGCTVSVRAATPSLVPLVSLTRLALQSRLLDLGVHVRDSAHAATEITVTLSENARGAVYLIQVKGPAETKTAIVEGLQYSPNSAPAASLVLRRSLLVSSDEPVLDAALIKSGIDSYFATLTPTRVTFYRQQQGRWEAFSNLPFEHQNVFPRDVRGRLVPAKDHLADVWLPGVTCTVNSTSALICRDADDAWPIGPQVAFFNSARNYFTGLLRPGFGRQFAPFFSAATVPFRGYTLWIFTGVDGQIRTFDGLREGTLGAATKDWGSDIASIRSGCRSGFQVLATAAVDDTSSDSLRAFEIVDRQPIAVTPAMEFDGSIVALWPSADEASATAVVRNKGRGAYDVYTVTLSCGQ